MLVATLANAACEPTVTQSATRPLLRFGASFAPLSEPLVGEFQKAFPNFDFKVERATDSKGVVAGIEGGTLDFGIALADIAYSAYWMSMHPGKTPKEEIRGVALLPPLSQYLIARRGSGIQQISDLHHRNIALGPKGTSSWLLGQLLLKSFDIEVNSVHETFTRADAAAGLKNGSIDAALFPGYVYPDEETYAAIREGAYLVPIEGAGVERMRTENPFIRIANIPRNIYPGQNRVVPTVGIEMVVICRRQLDEATVYEVTKQLFIAFPRVSGVEAMLRYFNLDEAPATPIPLHPGATRYFRERELSR